MNCQPVPDVPCGRDGPPDRDAVGLLDVLARELGASPPPGTGSAASCGVVRWARMGAQALTGPASGPPLLPPGPWAGRIDRVVAALAELTARRGARVDVDPRWLLASRAEETGWTRRGTVSANGSARLIATADGVAAVNLARPDDRDVLPAVLAAPVPAGSEWCHLSAWARNRPASEVVDALQVVGVPASVLGGHADAAALRVRHAGEPAAGRPAAAPLVVDFSAMWAGPLTAHLLHRAGARVVTVEDPRRPDGARGGPPRFYAELHRGHELRAVALRSGSARDELAALVETADIVIEASRPRALRGLGLHAEEWLAAAPGRTWVSVTGYGREAYNGMRVAFGDDAAVAGGLVARAADGTPAFAGDAIADPLTGLWAGTAAVASWTAGGGHLLDVSMAGVAAEVARPTTGSPHRHRLRADVDGHWWVSHEDEDPVRC